MSNPYEDPDVLPDVDLSDREARLWEQAIVTLFRDATTRQGVEKVELHGTRPDTQVWIAFRDRSGQLREAAWPIWDGPDLVWEGKLPSAATMGSAIFSEWSDGTLEAESRPASQPS